MPEIDLGIKHRSKYFRLEELVDRATFQLWGEEAWTLIHPDLVLSIDGVREFFNAPVTINNWIFGGNFQYRGYRGPQCQIGAEHSYHKRGMAVDLDIKGYDAEETRRIIIENKNNPLFSYIQRMEDNVTWVHIDLGQIPLNKSRIYLFKI